MIDDFAKEYLHSDLRDVRAAMVWKLDGLSEYDVRRPMTATGTNLLGLIKHLWTCEAWYFGEAFGRPFPGRWPRWDDPAGHLDQLSAAKDESRSEIVDRYRRAWEHWYTGHELGHTLGRFHAEFCGVGGGAPYP